MSTSSRSPQPAQDAPQDLATRALSIIGYILGISYPLLALSTGARGLYQYCCRADLTNKMGPLLSVFTAVLYVLAAVGFFKRTPRWWRISVGALSIELLFVLVIGTLSYIMPDLIGNTAWRHFGQDYGFFPLVQPLLGLIYLLWKPTRRAFGLTA